MSAQEALNRIASDWDEITDRLGRDKQVKFYREAIGYTGG